MTETMWDHSTFTRRRVDLLTPEVMEAFFAEIRGQAGARRLLSKEHFSVDGTLVEAAASLKSFRPKDEDPGSGGGGGTGGRNPEVSFHGEKRTNETHASTSDPDARLARKGQGKEARLAYTGHVLIENRNGLIVQTDLTPATGTAERDTALVLLEAERTCHQGPMTVGADAGYNTRGFVAAAREIGITPHVAEKTRHNAIDGRTTTWEGYRTSQRRRKIVEEVFGWMKTVGGMRKLLVRGLAKAKTEFILAACTYNLVRMRRLAAQAGPA
jgi:IS5 family transposase